MVRFSGGELGPEASSTMRALSGAHCTDVRPYTCIRLDFRICPPLIVVFISRTFLNIRYMGVMQKNTPIIMFRELCLVATQTYLYSL